MSFGESQQSENPYQSPQTSAPLGGDVNPSNRTAELLRQTRPWVRFLGIMGFISVGLMILVAAFMLLAVLSGGEQAGINSDMGPTQMLTMLVMYGLMSMLYIFPSMYLMRYANRINDFLQRGSTEALDSALEAQKTFWRFVGILIAAILTIYAVIIVFGIVVAIVSAVG